LDVVFLSPISFSAFARAMAETRTAEVNALVMGATRTIEEATGQFFALAGYTETPHLEYRDYSALRGLEGAFEATSAIHAPPTVGAERGVAPCRSGILDAGAILHAL
jgi:hypothetical protein